jgi:hypothetical protein
MMRGLPIRLCCERQRTTLYYALRKVGYALDGWNLCLFSLNGSKFNRNREPAPFEMNLKLLQAQSFKTVLES